jgi:hypothetical protein
MILLLLLILLLLCVYIIYGVASSLDSDTNRYVTIIKLLDYTTYNRNQSLCSGDIVEHIGFL